MNSSIRALVALALTLQILPSALAQGGITRFCTPGAAGSTISAGGSASFTAGSGAGDLVLHASNVPVGEFGFFFYGSAATAPFPIGNGFGCVGGALFRLPRVQSVAGSSTVSFPVDYLAPPSPAGAITPGSTWNFQFLFRSGANFDLSDAIEVRFGPPEPIVNWTTLLQGSKSRHPAALSTGGVFILSDAVSWASFWSLHTQGSTPPPPPPAVDFSQNDVVAAFAGWRGTSGYSLQVRRSGLSIATLGVTTLERCPGPNCGVFFTETQPFHFVLVPRIEHLALGSWQASKELNTCP